MLLPVLFSSNSLVNVYEFGMSVEGVTKIMNLKLVRDFINRTYQIIYLPVITQN